MAPESQILIRHRRSERALREQAERQRAERGTVQSVLSEARENLRLAADVQRELEAAERQTRSELVRISDGLYQAVFVQHGPAAADRLFCEEKTLELARDEAARLLAAARAALDAAQAKRLVEQQEIEAAAHAAADETVALTARLDTLRRQKLEIQIELKERRLFAKLLDTRDRLENEFFDKLHRHRLGLAHNLVVAGNQPPLDVD